MNTTLKLHSMSSAIVAYAKRAMAFAGLLAAMAATAVAAPIINNNTGSWTDTFTDNLGVRTVQQTVVDGAAGIVKLAAGQTVGTFTTVRIKPPSFDAWGTVKLSGTWSLPSDVKVSIVDPANGDALIAGPFDAGVVSLAGIDPVKYPEISLKVELRNGAVSPSVSDIVVSGIPSPCSLSTKSPRPTFSQASRFPIVYAIR